jgi:CRP/FNR family transcriptional regulator, cyclic AMP receptor protein
MHQTLEVIIREHPFFKGMGDRYIQFITGCAKNACFDAGDVIFREGDPADHFYLIREGLVAVELMIPNRGFTTVQTISDGDILGWSWLLPPYRSRFGARTVRPTRVLEFDGKCLRSKCDEDHDLGYEVLKRFAGVAAERLQATRLQLLDLYAAPA